MSSKFEVGDFVDVLNPEIIRILKTEVMRHLNVRAGVIVNKNINVTPILYRVLFYHQDLLGTVDGFREVFEKEYDSREEKIRTIEKLTNEIMASDPKNKDRIYRLDIPETELRLYERGSTIELKEYNLDILPFPLFCYFGHGKEHLTSPDIILGPDQRVIMLCVSDVICYTHSIKDIRTATNTYSSDPIDYLEQMRNENIPESSETNEGRLLSRKFCVYEGRVPNLILEPKPKDRKYIDQRNGVFRVPIHYKIHDMQKRKDIYMARRDHDPTSFLYRNKSMPYFINVLNDPCDVISITEDISRRNDYVTIRSKHFYDTFENGEYTTLEDVINTLALETLEHKAPHREQGQMTPFTPKFTLFVVACRYVDDDLDLNKMKYRKM